MFKMVVWQLFLATLSALEALACDTHMTGRILSRQEEAPQNPTRKYDYAASWNWVNLDPDAYGVCQNGTQQSPIPLSLANGLVRNLLLWCVVTGPRSSFDCLPSAQACRITQQLEDNDLDFSKPSFQA